MTSPDEPRLPRDRLKEIFVAAQALEGSDRDGFLAAACGADAVLRRRIDALLAADGAAGSFLASPTAQPSSTPSPHNEFDLLQRTLAGRYSIEREIGRGGMGVVYLATDVALGRQVAIKHLPEEAASRADQRSRFLREVRTAAGLAHPNIVPIHLVEERPDVVCFVMAFVDGETLRELVERTGPLSAGTAARVMQEVAWALAHAHDRGVVHRDIKPDNILIERATGRALVTDFGIASTKDSASTIDGGAFLGTPLFTSPEQAGGRVVDGRSDLYSLGATVFYATTGRPVFNADIASRILQMHVSEAPPPLGALRPDLPPSLIQAVDRCLSKRPEDRIATAEELAKGLSSTVAGSADVPEPIRRFVQEVGQLTADIGGWLLFTIASVSGWYLDRITANGFLTELGVYVLIVLSWLGAVFTLLRIVDAVSEARHVLNRGYEASRIQRALRGLSETRTSHLVQTRGRGAIPTLLLAFVTVVSWLYKYYSPLAPPSEWLGLVFDTLASVGPLMLGRVLTKAALSREHGASEFLRRVKARVGGFVLRLAALRSRDKSHSPAGHPEPTEMVLLEATDAVLAQLPADYRRRLSGVPALLRRLERHADALRSRRAELEGALANGRRSGRAVIVDDVLDGPANQLRLNADRAYEELRNAHNALGARLADVITALEAVRLGVLRLRAGVAMPSDLTVDLDLAIEVGNQVDALLYGEAEANRIAVGGLSLQERQSAVPRFARHGDVMSTTLFVGLATLVAALGNGQSKQSGVESVPVHISSMDTKFASRGEFKGVARVTTDSVTVIFESSNIAIMALTRRTAEYHLDSISVSLTYGTGDRWNFSQTSRAFVIPDSLAERPRFSLGRLVFTVPRSAAAELSKSWITVTFYQIVSPAIVPREQQGTGTSYAHSAPTVFAGVRSVAKPSTIPVTVASTNLSFMTTGVLTGRIQVLQDSLVVTFDKADIEQKSDGGRSWAHLDSLTVGLATSRSGSGWRVYSDSKAYVVPESLAEQVKFSLGRVKLTIPRSRDVPLTESWLVVTFHQIDAPGMVPAERRSRSTTNAHSPRGLFAGMGG